MLFELIATFTIVGLYGWLSIIECGVSLLRLLPRTTLTKQGLRLATPVWGLTNALLIVAMLVLAIFFGRSTMAVIHLILPALLTGLGVLVVRSVLIIQLFYGKAKTGFTAYNLLYCVLTFMLPLSFGGAGIRLLSGSNFWQSGLGWVLLGALLAGLIALSVSFVYFVVGHTPHDRLHQVASWLTVLLAALLALGLKLTVTDRTKHLHSSVLPVFELLVLSVIIVQGGLSLVKRDRYMWWYLSLFAILTPMLLALADRANLLALR